MKKNQRGFTLIELLVVIAIIGLLSTLSIISLSAARSRARDAKRMADLRNLQSALELFASEKGTYPVTADINNWYPINEAGGCIDGQADKTTAFKVSGCAESLMTLAPDAVNGATYAYQYKPADTDGTKYAIWVALEAKTGACATPEGVKDSVVRSDCPVASLGAQ